MLKFENLKSLRKHEGSVWSLKWSNSGSFLASCGTDGRIVFWGPLIIQFGNWKKKKTTFYRNFFLFWGQISFFNSLNPVKTLRKLNFFFDTNEFCLGGFSGICLLCKIEFKKKKKFSFLEIEEKLPGLLSEIKGCSFSPDGVFISASGRDRTVWVWEKNFFREYQCLFIIMGHESDVKDIDWHPGSDTLISSTYKGVIRNFQIKKEKPENLFSFKSTNSSIWSLKFDQNGEEFYGSSNEGMVMNFSLITQIDWNFKKNNIFKNPIIFWTKGMGITDLSFSESSGIISECDEKGNLNLIKKKKYWANKKPKKIEIGKIKQNHWLNLEASLVRLHSGRMNSLMWHPVNENIIASCGEDSVIQISSVIFCNKKQLIEK